MLPGADVLVLLVAVGGLLFAFSTQGSVVLTPSWHHRTDLRASDWEVAPIVADVDGDGTPELLVATQDGRLLLLGGTAPAAANLASDAGSPWRKLHLVAEASLRSQLGLTSGRRPVAIGSGPARMVGGGVGGSSAETHTIIALTEDWTVHAFDHTLRPLWQHSAALTLEPESVQIEASDQPIDEAHHGGRASQSSVSFAEAVVIISPQPIYGGDRGFVFIGGRHAPSHSVRSLSARSHLARSHLAAAPLDEDPVDEGAGGRLWASSAPTPRNFLDDTSHFDFVLLEGGSGRSRWEHRASDFIEPLRGDATLTPQMDYRLNLETLGGEGILEPGHQGEQPWRAFKQSLLNQAMPFSWRHPHDTGAHLASFAREQRAAPAARWARGGGRHTARTSAADEFSLGNVLRQRLRGWGEAPAVATADGGADVGGAPRVAGAAVRVTRAPADAIGRVSPNVLVVHRQNGIEVLHLYTGRTLCRLPLASREAHAPQAHGDINGDGALDRIVAHSGVGSGMGGGMSACHGAASRLSPVTEELWVASTCARTARVRLRERWSSRSPPPAEGATGAVAPLLLRREGERNSDAVFLMSNGVLTSVAPEGGRNWMLQTVARWQPHPEATEHLHTDDGIRAAVPFASLSALRPTAGAQPLILALGERAAVLVDAQGKELGVTALPSVPVAPPLIGDFDGDNVVDVIIPVASGHIGLSVKADTCPLLLRVLFGVSALGMLSVLVLREQHLLQLLSAAATERDHQS